MYYACFYLIRTIGCIGKENNAMYLFWYDVRNKTKFSHNCYLVEIEYRRLYHRHESIPKFYFTDPGKI